MENRKYNFNFKIKEKWSGYRRWSFSGILFFVIVNILLGIAVVLPILLAEYYFLGIFLFLVFIGVSFISSIKLGGQEAYFKMLWNWIKFQFKVKKMEPSSLYQNKLIKDEDNFLAFKNKKQILFKSFWIAWNDNVTFLNEEQISNLKERINDLILQNREIRINSLDVKFDVNSNMKFVNELMENNFDLEMSKEEFINDKLNQLLAQQALKFVDIQEKYITNKITVIEYSKVIEDSGNENILNSQFREFQIESENILNSLKTFAFSSLIFIKAPMKYEMDDIKENHLLFNQQDLTLKFKNTYIEVQSENSDKTEYIKYWKLNNLPFSYEPGFIYNLQNDLNDYNTMLHIHKLTDQENDEIFASLEKGLDSYIKKNSRSFWKRKKAEQEIIELEEQMERAFEAKDDYVGMSFILQIKADSKKELNEKTKSLILKFKKSNISFSKMRFQQNTGFLDFHQGYQNNFTDRVDIHWIKFKLKKKKWAFNDENIFWVTTDLISYGLPFGSYHSIEDNAFYNGVDKFHNPVSMNFEKNIPSRHEIIIGASGLGKTTIVFLKLMYQILRAKSLKKDKKQWDLIFIFDPKGEYKNFVEFMGGKVIDVSKGLISPFVYNQNQDIKEKEIFLNAFFENILDINYFQNKTIINILSDIVLNSEKYKQNQFNFNDLIEEIRKSSEIKKVFSNEEKIESLIIQISKFASDGTQSELFGKNFDITEKDWLVCFNLQSILVNASSNSLSNISSYIVIDYILNRMRQNGSENNAKKRKIDLWIDEFHTIVINSDNFLLNQISLLMSLFRSYGGAIHLILHNLHLLENNKNAQSHLGNILSNVSYFNISSLGEKDLSTLGKIWDQIGILNSEDLAFIKEHNRWTTLTIAGKNKEQIFWDWSVNYDESKDFDDDGKKIRRQGDYVENKKNWLEFLSHYWNDYHNEKEQVE